jgi:flagellin-specific chaperone FliS
MMDDRLISVDERFGKARNEALETLHHLDEIINELLRSLDYGTAEELFEKYINLYEVLAR